MSYLFFPVINPGTFQTPWGVVIIYVVTRHQRGFSVLVYKSEPDGRKDTKTAW
jgi:hypothetical protein